MKLANDHIVTTLQNIIFFLNVFVFLQLIYTYLRNKMMQDIKILRFLVFWKKSEFMYKRRGYFLLGIYSYSTVEMFAIIVNRLMVKLINL